MSFIEIFFKVLVRRPGAAMTALYWRMTGRRVRSENQLRASIATLPIAYEIWQALHERNSAAMQLAPATVSSWTNRPAFSVLLYHTAAASPGQIAASIESVRQQCYETWDLRVAGPLHLPTADDPRIAIMDQQHGGSLADLAAAAAATGGGEYLLPLQAGHRLSPMALFRFAEAIQSHPQAGVLFGDQDSLDGRGKRQAPWLKPLWNAEMFLAQDYISAACAIRTGALGAGLPLPAEYAAADAFGLVLAASEQPGAGELGVVHVPHVLCHLPDDAPRQDAELRRRAVARHVAAWGATAKRGAADTIEVEWPLPEPAPMVSIIVPTRDKLYLLEACIGSLLALTDYPNYEILIVDNGSEEAVTKAYFAKAALDQRVRVLSFDAPYNFSAINNFAVSAVRGAFLCLLNNDTEIVERDWLSQLMRQAVRPLVGAAGAKLLYADGTVQHAGVVIGMGRAAGHAHRHLPPGEPGYFNQAHIARFVSAVTAACLVMEKDKFEAVGGLDAEQLAIAFNDVDLCLKLERHGWRNVYVPQAVLIHHESISRGSDLADEHVERYTAELSVLQGRWGTREYVDPLHHPRLDRASEIYALKI